mgnify:CR=1 FL=1
MILKRMSSAVRARDWGAVLLELLMVRAGVFLGIQFGNWNNARAVAGLRPESTVFRVARACAVADFKPDDVVAPGLLREARGEVNSMHTAHLLQTFYQERSLMLASQVLGQVEEARR